jgi:tRNA U34 5-methylaminomethyl-2-thiouridine-forming methyltransferase MnmC
MRFELRKTTDGSLTVFDDDVGECFKSRHAARLEAEHVFFAPAVREHPLAGQRPLEVAELGFGLGTNFQHFLAGGFRGTFRSIERDLAGAEFYLSHAPDHDLAQLVARGEFKRGEFHATLERGDFFEVLRGWISAGAQVDALLFDPFSPKANPHAWTNELFALAFALLRPGGRLVTYSVCRTAKDVAQAAGFIVTKRHLPPELRKRSALLAVKPASRID